MRWPYRGEPPKALTPELGAGVDCVKARSQGKEPRQRAATSSTHGALRRRVSPCGEGPDPRLAFRCALADFGEQGDRSFEVDHRVVLAASLVEHVGEVVLDGASR